MIKEHFILDLLAVINGGKVKATIEDGVQKHHYGQEDIKTLWKLLLVRLILSETDTFQIVTNK